MPQFPRRKYRMSPVEHLVVTYLKKVGKSNNRSERAIIEKAAKMIAFTLVDPCCTNDGEALGRVENYFIIQLRSLLNGIDIKKWRDSLQRAGTLLTNQINDPCCE